MALTDLFLDACVLINLCATGRFTEISSASHYTFVATNEVAQEALYLDPDSRDAPRMPIDVPELHRTGALVIVELADEELPTFVEYAARLDEGEASTLSACLHRGASVATDDRASLRFILERGISVPVQRTPGLIRSWAEHANLTADEVHTTLRRVQRQAHFRPNPADPNFNWWNAMLAD